MMSSSTPPASSLAPAASASTSLPPSAALLLAALPLPRPTSIIDVGANPINEAPYSALLRAGACHVTGFEPQPDAFAELQRIKGALETYHPHAVGDGSTQTLHIYASSGLTSIFPPHLPGLRALGRPRWSRVLQRIDMKTLTLDAIPDLAPCDLLKIDIQGGEKLVFDNATRVLSDAVAVIVELRYMQLYEGEPMTGGVDESLRKQGFMLHKFMFNKSQPFPHSQAARLNRRRTADQLIDGDAVYLRHPGQISRFTDAQLMHLAVLAATVFSSHSATLYALDELVQRGLVPADLPARYVDALPDALKSGERPADAATPDSAAEAMSAARAADAPSPAPKTASLKTMAQPTAAASKSPSKPTPKPMSKPTSKSSAPTTKARSAGS
jgi:FkbM family methyltransferase